jgi:hypothetical protein
MCHMPEPQAETGVYYISRVDEGHDDSAGAVVGHLERHVHRACGLLVLIEHTQVGEDVSRLTRGA